MRVLGITSGTSCDAIEALVTELEMDGELLLATLLDHVSTPYPPWLREAIASALPPATTTAEQICKLDNLIGQAFGSVAAEIAKLHGPFDLVCSHGQTVFHWVEGRTAKGTLQLGEPAWIAELTGCAVVSNLRSRDIAAGGQGAPLVPLLDVLLLGTEPTVPTASLNLGGIANVTVLRRGYEPLAWDTGPANALIDATVQWLSGGRELYDHGGSMAASGNADPVLVGRLLDDPYFSLLPPKSTGKELFNLSYVVSRLATEEIEAADIIASVTAATAESIASALRPYGLAELFVAGGGTRNPTLMTEIERRLPGTKFRAMRELGVPETAKEALLFAIIGYFTLCGIPANIVSCTGASHTVLLGSLTPGERGLPAKVMAHKPTRLIVRDAQH